MYEKGEVGNQTDTFFLIMNPVGITGDAINSTLKSLSSCYTTKINDLDNIQTYLLIAGVCVLIFSFAGIMIASIAADKSINYLWEHFRNKILDAYAELSQNIAARLKDCHEETETLVDVLEHQHENSEKYNFKHSMRYLLIILPLFIVAGGLYCALVLPIFNILQGYLEVKPNLMSSIYEARFCILNTYFWTTESMLANTTLDLRSIYSGFVHSPNIDWTAISFIYHLHSIKGIFYLPDIKPLISDQVYSELYQAYPNVSYYFDMGILSAMDMYGIESLSIIDYGESLVTFSRDSYLLFAIDLAIVLRALSYAIYEDSNNYIEAELKYFMIYIGGFCICLMITYSVFYYPHLRKEEKVLKTLKKLMRYIPSMGMKKSKAARTQKVSERKRSLKNLE